MSNPIKDGGPAFPVATDFSRVNSGMTLRDYFAGQALAVVAMPASDGSQCTNADKLAQWAYAQADAMLAAREAKQ